MPGPHDLVAKVLQLPNIPRDAVVRQMVLLEPPGIDARLPAGLVLREAGVARHPMGRTQHPRCTYRRPTANSGRWASQPCAIGSAWKRPRMIFSPEPRRFGNSTSLTDHEMGQLD